MADTGITGEHIVAPTAADDDVLRVEHLSKRFGPVTALRDINMHLRKGEVLGLLGDNGAGKSTLVKIICGFQKPDGGRMFLRGEPYEPRSVDHSRSLGIDTVYQDLALVDELSVFHNMFLRREKVHSPVPFLANRIMRNQTREALDDIGVAQIGFQALGSATATDALTVNPPAVARDATFQFDVPIDAVGGSTSRSRACPAGSVRRSRSLGPCTPRPTSCCSTSRSPPWAPRRGRSSST